MPWLRKKKKNKIAPESIADLKDFSPVEPIPTPPSTKPTSTNTYKVYTAILNQSGAQAPVSTILENTIGEIVWTRISHGVYKASCKGAFAIDKTSVFVEPLSSENYQGITIMVDKKLDYITLGTYRIENQSLEDNLLKDSTIEIRVYP